MGGERFGDAGESGDGLEAFVYRGGGHADGPGLLLAGRVGGHGFQIAEHKIAAFRCMLLEHFLYIFLQRHRDYLSRFSHPDRNPFFGHIFPAESQDVGNPESGITFEYEDFTGVI